MAEAIGSIKYAWRHRKGHEIPGNIVDTFENLGFETKDGRKPVLVTEKRLQNGWHLVFNLPPGIKFREVKDKLDYFQDATNCHIELTWNGKLQMQIQEGNIPSQAPYAWNPEEYKDLCLPTPIGISYTGLEVLDLAESPHLLVAGVPGFGKSNFLHTLIHSLLSSAFIAVIDLKRLEFAYLKDYCALARNEQEALQLMIALNKEMERRIDILEGLGVVKVQEYKGDMPFIVLVVDELAEIKNDKVLYYIDRIVRLARAVGISVVGATQRPSTKVIDGDTRAMFAARLCFQVADEVNSRIVLGESCSAAAHLPGIKGRAIYRFGIIEKEVQTMYLPLANAKKLLDGLKVPGRRIRYDEPKTKRLLPR